MLLSCTCTSANNTVAMTDRKDNFVKTRHQTNHAARIENELKKQFNKNSKLRANKISTCRSNFYSIDDETPTISACTELLTLDQGTESISSQVIRAFDRNLKQNIEVAFPLIEQFQVMKRVELVLATISTSDVEIGEEDLDLLRATVDFLATVSSLSNIDLAHQILSCFVTLTRYISRQDFLSSSILFQLVLIMGNISRYPSIRNELLKVVPIILAHTMITSQPDVIAISCWFLSVFIDPVISRDIFSEVFGVITRALSSVENEVVSEGLWLLGTVNEVIAERNDITIDPVYIAASFKYLTSSSNHIIEPLLYIIGSSPKAHYGLIDNEAVAAFFNRCLSMDENDFHIAKTAFSVANKLIIGLPSPVHITPDIILRRLEELICSESYSLHIEIVHFVDVLLASHHPSMYNRTHFFCEMIVHHMSYIFNEDADVEVLMILMEIIYHELVSHQLCSVRELIMSSQIGEALDNLAIVSENQYVRNLSGKLVEVLYSAEEDDCPDHFDQTSFTANTQPRMGRGSSAVKPAWMN